MSKHQYISVLCAAKKSVYHKIPGLDVYDVNRDCRSYEGDLPVIAHPPCRGWSAFMSHFSKASDDEKNLAYFCLDKIRQNGGVLEHPMHSNFVKQFIDNPDFKVETVYQSWFGYPVEKKTWLLMPKHYRMPELPFNLESPFIPGEQKKAFENMSHFQRHETNLQFANYLIDLVNLNHKLHWS